MHPIYIVIAVLLLWLYYTKKDASILAAFIVVVLATFMNKRKEGLFNKSSGDKGGDSGGDSGDGPKCSVYGFKDPDIKSDDIDKTFKKEITNIKNVANTHWTYDDMFGTTKDKSKTTILTNVKDAVDSAAKRYADENEKPGDATRDATNAFIEFCANAYGSVVNKTEEKKKTAKTKVEELDLDMVIEGGEETMKTYYYVYSSDEVNNLTKSEKKLTGYIVCLFSQYLKIAKALKAAKEEE